MKNNASEPAKLLDCACLFWRFSFDASRTGPFAIRHLAI
jgi:hypothetical protein